MGLELVVVAHLRETWAGQEHFTMLLQCGLAQGP